MSDAGNRKPTSYTLMATARRRPMAKGNNAQKKETKKPKKAAVKGAADKPKDTKKK